MVMLHYMRYVAEDSLEVPWSQTLSDNNKHSLVVNTLFVMETREYIFTLLMKSKMHSFWRALYQSLHNNVFSSSFFFPFLAHL